MDQFEPRKIRGKGDNDRLIDEGDDDRGGDFFDPPGFEDIGANEYDGDGKDQLIEEGIDGVDLPGKVFFDVEGGGAPEDGCCNLQQVSDEHHPVINGGLAPENQVDPEKGEDQTHCLDGI